MLDYSTVVIADKFGSVSVIRLPSETNEDTQVLFTPLLAFDKEGLGRSQWSKGSLVERKLERRVAEGRNHQQLLCWRHDYFYPGSIFSFHRLLIIPKKTILIPGGGECIVYATMSGRIGILVPFASNEDADFFQNLEMHMRQEHLFLARAHFLLIAV